MRPTILQRSWDLSQTTERINVLWHYGLRVTRPRLGWNGLGVVSPYFRKLFETNVCDALLRHGIQFLNLPSDIIKKFSVEVVNKGCNYLRDCQLCIPITFDSIDEQLNGNF